MYPFLLGKFDGCILGMAARQVRTTSSSDVHCIHGEFACGRTQPFPVIDDHIRSACSGSKLLLAPYQHIYVRRKVETSIGVLPLVKHSCFLCLDSPVETSIICIHHNVVVGGKNILQDVVCDDRISSCAHGSPCKTPWILSVGNHGST